MTAKSTPAPPGAVADAVQAAAAPEPPPAVEPWPDTMAESLVRALGALSNVAKTKTATVPHKNGGSHDISYADLADVLEMARPVLARFGLAIMQGVANEDGMVSVRTTITHWKGETFTTEPLRLPRAGDPQGVGSAITYGRRYQLSALLNVASEADDDGQAARPSEPAADSRRRVNTGRAARPSKAATSNTPDGDAGEMSGIDQLVERYAALRLNRNKVWLDARAMATAEGIDAPTQASKITEHLLDGLDERYAALLVEHEAAAADGSGY